MQANKEKMRGRGEMKLSKSSIAYMVKLRKQGCPLRDIYAKTGHTLETIRRHTRMILVVKRPCVHCKVREANRGTAKKFCSRYCMFALQVAKSDLQECRICKMKRGALRVQGKVSSFQRGMCKRCQYLLDKYHGDENLAVSARLIKRWRKAVEA